MKRVALITIIWLVLPVWLVLSVILLTGIFSLIPFSVSAENSPLKIGISPHTFELDIFPGEKINEKIKISNLSEIPLPINARVVDFTAQDETGEMIFEEISKYPSLSSRLWFKIQEPDFILEPKETKEIHFSIEVPSDAEIGGKYAVILFEPVLPSFYFQEGQPKTIPVVGVLFLMSVRTLSLEKIISGEPIEILEFYIPKEERLQELERVLANVFRVIPRVLATEINIVEEPPSNFVLRLKNDDVFHHLVEGRVLLYNVFGKEIGEGEIAKTTILPGKTRHFEVETKQEIPSYLKWLPQPISGFLMRNAVLGKCQAQLILTTKDTIIEKEFGFWTLPWKTGTSVILILVLMTLFLIKYGKRVRLATLILFKPKKVDPSTRETQD